MYTANNPNYYCDNIVMWPVSADVQANAYQHSKDAYALYYDLKERYLNGTNDPNAPSLDCLAVAQEFYCAYTFPYCLNNEQPKRGICTFFCKIWADRCPNEEYNRFCANSADNNCSFSQFLLITMTAILLI